MGKATRNREKRLGMRGKILDFPQKGNDSKEDPWEDERFSGTCPTCGQPFCMEYVSKLENTLIVMKQAVQTLETANNIKDKKISKLEEKRPSIILPY